VRFLLPRTQLRRVPLLRRLLPCGRTRGTRIARPSSVPSSGFLPLSTVPAGSRLARDLWSLAVRRGPLRFAAFFHAARVPGAPLQSFPFPRSRTRSRGPPASLRVRSPTSAGAAPAGSSRPLSPVSRQLVAARARPEADPGRMSRDEGFSRSLVRSPRRTRGRAARTVHSPPTLGSPVRDRHARFEALLPPGVRSATTSSPGQAEAARRCSPGVLDPPELTPLRFGVRYLASTCAGGQSPMPRTPPGAQPSRLHSATRTPTPELASPGSVDAQGL